MIQILPQAFPLGRLRISPRCRQVFDMAGESEWRYLFLHGSATWVADEDRNQFDHAVENDDEIVSYHVLANGARIAVRTVEGHTETTIMLADEL